MPTRAVLSKNEQLLTFVEVKTILKNADNIVLKLQLVRGVIPPFSRSNPPPPPPPFLRFPLSRNPRCPHLS